MDLSLKREDAFNREDEKMNNDFFDFEDDDIDVYQKNMKYSIDLLKAQFSPTMQEIIERKARPVKQVQRRVFHIRKRKGGKLVKVGKKVIKGNEIITMMKNNKNEFVETERRKNEKPVAKKPPVIKPNTQGNAAQKKHILKNYYEDCLMYSKMLKDTLDSLDMEIIKILKVVMCLGKDEEHYENMTPDKIYKSMYDYLDEQGWGSKANEIHYLLEGAEFALGSYLQNGFKKLDIQF